MKSCSDITSYAGVLMLEATGKPNLPDSTYQMITRGAAINPQARALTFFLNTDQHKNPESWTYQALLEHIHQFANFLHELGANKETVIAYILPNLPETHFVIWGGQAAGIVAAINPMLEPDAMADLLNAAGASILVTLAPFPGTDSFAKVCQVLPKVHHLQHLVLVNLCDRVWGHKHQAAKDLQQLEVLRLCGANGIHSLMPAHIQLHDFKEAISCQVKNRLLSARQFDSNDYSSFFCTGGTTGTPKIAMRTHGNEVSNAWSAGQFLGAGSAQPKKVFCGLPLFHVNAVLVTGLLPFSTGAEVVLGTPQGYRGDGIVARFWEIVEFHNIQAFSGVPTLYANLLQVPVTGWDISSLEYGLCGAAPMPVELLRRFQDMTGVKILEGYGLTEGTCVSSVNPLHGQQQPGSIGIRIPGQQMKTVVLDENHHYIRDCNTNEVGIIAIAGPNVFSGYKIAGQNRQLWLDTGDGKKWLNTGDLGRCDAQGYFWLTGRKKELIIRGGHNIDPSTIEDVLHQHAAVQLAAAVGRPDANAGELPVAYVQLKPGTQATSEELMAFARNNIRERAAVPKHIEIISAIPLTAVGKIFKPALKQREIQSALTSVLVEAGIQDFIIEVSEDKTFGTTVSVQLANDKLIETRYRERAEQVLAQYPFRFVLSCQENLAQVQSSNTSAEPVKG